MDYYVLSGTGDLNNQSLCLLEDPPEGMEKYQYCLGRGVPAAPHYPENAICRLRPENPGIKLAGILGNTIGALVVSQQARDIIHGLCPHENIEYLNFTLMNQKGRVHSKEYYFVNPIGGFDCLNEPACGIQYDADGEAVTIGKYILDAGKIAKAPHLFRIDKAPHEYVASYDLLVALYNQGITNLMTTKLKTQ